MEPELGLIEQSFNVRYSNRVREALDELPDSFTITDPSIAGHPIVFASRGFLKMSGYSKDEVIGRNGRMFQGPKTDRRTMMEIWEAILAEKAMQISALNYRKDGTPFWMLFHMCPVFSKEDGRVIHFVGVQVPILKKSRQSAGDVVRNGLNLHEDVSGFRRCCRKEVHLDSVVELGRVMILDSFLGSDADALCEASDLEKQKATTAMNNILSVLTQYSELTGRLVCEKRCSSSGIESLGASLTISLGRIKQSFVLTDPHLRDMPIVYASDAFLKMTGYTRDEVLGRNCRLLSGKETDSSTLFQIKESIQTEQACTVNILNYRKDKTSFWNFLHISPVRNASGKIAYFIGVQIDKSCMDQENQVLSPEIRLLSIVGAVKVTVRSLLMIASTSNS